MSGGMSRRNLLQAGGVLTLASAGGFVAPSGAWAGRTHTTLPDEDGYELWLRYPLVTDPAMLHRYRRQCAQLVVAEKTPMVNSARAELVRGLSGLLGHDISVVDSPTARSALVVGTWDGSSLVRQLVDRGDVHRVGPEGFVLRSVQRHGRHYVVVAAGTDRGLLYGAFGLLRRMQRYLRIDRLDVSDQPTNSLRLANHWDNLNETVERGYAGNSIFQWDQLPTVDHRITDYARTLASIGVNGTVVNNVNANPQFLTSPMITKLAALADTLRPWGVRFHLSANFAAPLALHELDTADPEDARVQAWWRDKATEIYDAIPDFGGFLVKANSEGQPGPVNYGRTHAQGANMLARALAPHGGIVMWRAFVYDASDGDVSTDAYDTFTPLDGQFDDNVVLQTKYGPVDFHIREPVHPLFGAMPDTNMMIELQITQEHTGHATDLCYLPVWWKQVLDFDTYAKGRGSTVATVVDGSLYHYSHAGAAGVMNFGDDRNWTGSHLAAANTHGFGRLLWNPAQHPADLAREWAELTFGPTSTVVKPLLPMLLGSWKTFENYTSPLGVGDMVRSDGDHYMPDPQASQPNHRSDSQGTGFDRTVATGTGFTGLYHQPWSSRYESLSTMPDELLLFMHHVPYTHRLHSGRTVIEHIYDTHFVGLETVHGYRDTWASLHGALDEQRYNEILATFGRHVAHATIWRDSIVSYFFSLSRILGRSRSWVQVDIAPRDTLLLGGWPTRVPMTLGNASARDLAVRVRLDAPAGWQARTVGATVSARDFTSVVAPVVPPVAGLDTTEDMRVEAGDLPVLGAKGVEFLVTPAPSLCHLALDAGTARSELFGGYARLSPDMAWDPARGYGWVGKAPESRDRGGTLDALRRDFCNAPWPATLRIQVPAGSHQAYLLIGDGAVGSEPTIIRSGGVELARSRRLASAQFQWLHITVDGSSSGRAVDLELSSIPGAHWHLVAFTMVNQDATPPAVVVGEVTPQSLLMLPAEKTTARFWLYNFTASDITVHPRLTVPAGYTATLSRDSVTVPGNGDAEIDVEVVRAADTTASGTLVFTLEGDSRTVPLSASDNWVRIATLSASSTHAPSAVGNLNDGNTDSERWGPGGAGGWNDGTAKQFPDSVTATWPHPVPLARVKVYTLDSRAYPAADWGVRDYDLQVRVAGAWHTIAQVRSNVAGMVESRFSTVQAEALRITVLDSNDHSYARLIEIEAYST